MAPPAGYNDFYELELQVNYNNSSNPQLQAPIFNTSGTQPPQEQQAGWTERYSLLPTVQSPLGPVPMANAYTLVQARAALLGINFYIKKAVVHQASAFKSSFPMPQSAKYPLFDGQASALGNSFANQLCSSPEEALLFRLEASNLYRSEHMIRGLKDYVADDSMSYFQATSFADAATFATTSVFDTLQQAIPIPGITGGAAATVTFTTNSDGSLASLTLGTGGTFPQVANGLYWFYVFGNAGQTIPALGYSTMTGNTFGALTLSTSFRGLGYSGTAGTIQLSNDPNGLQNYLPPSTYWANFISCLISFTQSGVTRRISQSTYTAPVPTFPSGMAAAFFGVPNKTNRCMLQRVANRQTGQIRLTKPARRRIAR